MWVCELDRSVEWFVFLVARANITGHRPFYRAILLWRLYECAINVIVLTSWTMGPVTSSKRVPMADVCIAIMQRGVTLGKGRITMGH